MQRKRLTKLFRIRPPEAMNILRLFVCIDSVYPVVYNYHNNSKICYFPGVNEYQEPHFLLDEK